MRPFRVASAILTVSLATLVGGVSQAPGPVAGAPPPVTITGVVAGGHGNLASGSVQFYTGCDTPGPVEFAHIRSGVFTAILPAGQYRVLIRGETVSWHDAQPTCQTATVLTFDSDTYVTLRAIPLYSVTGTVATVRGPVTGGSVRFYADCAAAEVASASIIDGSFTEKLTPGTYRARIVPGQRASAKDSWHNATAACSAADVITVTGDQTVALQAIATQRVSLRQPKTVRAGITFLLPAKTRQGIRVKWTGRPKKVCAVRRAHHLKTLKTGTCQLVVTAPAAAGLAEYTGLFAINVYTPRGKS